MQLKNNDISFGTKEDLLNNLVSTDFFVVIYYAQFLKSFETTVFNKR